MTGETQQEFNNAISDFGTWIELVEKRLQPSDTYSLPSEEMNRICNEIEEEVGIRIMFFVTLKNKKTRLTVFPLFSIFGRYLFLLNL